MAALGQFHLDNVFAQIDVSDGVRYLDRCGETVLDLMRTDDAWTFVEANLTQGLLYHLASGCTLKFNGALVNLTRGDAAISQTDFIELFSQACHVIRRNLGFQEVVRLGYRTMNLVNSASVEDAEDRIRKWELFTVSPKITNSVRAREKNNQHVIVFEENGSGLRLSVSSITREQGKMPSELLKKDEKMLAKKQRHLFAKRLQEMAQYRKDPRFAVLFDLDYYMHDPEFADIGGFLRRSEESRIELLSSIGVRL